MKKFLTIFFVVLGVIIFILILFATYFYITDPLNLKPLFFGDSELTLPEGNSSADAVDKNPVLSPAQEQALESVGIDPATVPSSITPEQETCFVELFGQARVDEITAGDSPTATELLRGRACIE